MEASTFQVKAIMTQKVFSISPEKPIQDAILMLTKYDFNGIPVVDKDKKLVGLFTEKNMLSEGPYVHLRTLLKLFSEMNYYKRDHDEIKGQLKDIVKLKVKDIMNAQPTVMHETDGIDDARGLFLNGSVDTIPILDANEKLVGILSASDFTKFYGNPLPRKVREKDIDQEIDHFVKDFEDKFIIVSKVRARVWVLSSLALFVAGFAVAMFFILRISFE
jgi:CBS domain-containing protein